MAGTAKDRGIAAVAIVVRHFFRPFAAPDGVAGTVRWKCYIVTISGFVPIQPGLSMTHHNHGGEPHPSPVISPSLLRLSAPQRLAVAGGLIAVIWVAFLWATH
jgi:hypothetical protein